MVSRIPARTRRAWLMRAVLAATLRGVSAASAQQTEDALGLRGSAMGDKAATAPEITGAIPFPGASWAPAPAATPSAPAERNRPPQPRKTPRSARGAQTPAVAAAPIAPRRRPATDERPFDPPGARVGDIRILPYVQESLGWSSNPQFLPGSQRASGFLRSEGGLILDADGASHVIHADLKGGWTDYFANSSADAPDFNGLVKGRWDASSVLYLEGEARSTLATMTPGSLGLSPNVAFGPDGAPLTATTGATLGGGAKLGRFNLSLHGSFDRTTYEDVTYSNGVTENLSADDFDDWGLRGRVVYELSPALRPFFDVLVDARRYGDGLDAYDYARNSEGIMARAGVEIDLAKTLTGGVSFGYGTRTYDDPRLPNLSSPLVDASLVWTPTALTTVLLRTVSSLAETTIRGASGAAQHATTLEVAHALRRFLTVTPSVSYVTDSYAGVSRRDATTTLGLTASYSLSRNTVFKASLSRAFYTSNQPGTNACATIVSVGLRLQR